MSETATTGLLGPKRAQVAKKPSLACVGRVSSVEEHKDTESGIYVNQPIKVEAEGAGIGVTINLLYRPEWFNPGFDPDEEYKLNQAETQAIADDRAGGQVDQKALGSAKLKRGLYFVYGKNVASSDGLSVIEGIAGTDEGAAKLLDAIYRLGNTEAEDFSDRLRELLQQSVVGNRVGYVMKQAQKKTDQKNSEGKWVYSRLDKYELDTFWFPTDEGKAGKKRAAKQSAAKAQKTGGVPTFKVAF